MTKFFKFSKFFRGAALLGALALFAYAFAGCGSTGSTGGKKTIPGLGDACTFDRDCKDGLSCVSGFCQVKNCKSSEECATGFSCIVGTCIENMELDGDKVEADKDEKAEIEEEQIEYEEGAKPKISYPDAAGFGAAFLNIPVSREITIKNIGDAPLKLIYFYIEEEIPQQEFKIDVAPAINSEVPPAGEATFTLVYNMKNEGTDSAYFYIVTNDETVPNNAAKIHLTTDYKGTPIAYFDVSEVNFGLVLTETHFPKRQTVKLCNAENDGGNAQLVVTSVSLDDPLNDSFKVFAPLTPFSLNAPRGGGEKDCAELIVEFRPMERDILTENLTVTSNDNKAPGTKSVIPISGRGSIPNIEVEPTSLDFGKVKLNRSKAIPLLIHSVGDAPLVVRDVKLSDNCSSAYGITDKPPVITLQPGEKTSATLTYLPRAARIDLCMLKIYATSEEDETTNNPVILTVQGEGVPGYVSVLPDNLDFGSVIVGRSAQLPFQLVNTSAVDVEVEKFEFDQNCGPYKILKNPANPQDPTDRPPFTMNASETKLFWAIFSPYAEGPVNCKATVKVVEMAADSPKLTLGGGGVLPLIEIVPETLIIDKAQVGVKNSTQFNINNNGTASLEIGEVNVAPVTARSKFKIVDSVSNEILPSSSAPVKIEYTPPALGDEMAWLYVCSNASNANASGCPECYCADPALSPQAAIIMTHAIAPEIKVVATSSDAGVTIRETPVHVVNFGFLVFGSPPKKALAEIKNVGKGPLTILGVSLDSEEGPFKIESVATPSGKPFPLDIAETETIKVSLSYTAPEIITGPQFNTLVVDHDDKDSPFFPKYRLQLKANSGSNTEPLAIIHSPAGDPADPKVGKRRLNIPEPDVAPCPGCLCMAEVDGSTSYDVDPDDSVTAWEWDAAPWDAFKYPPGSNNTTPKTKIGFTKYGETTVTLQVADQNGGKSFSLPDSVLVVDCQAYPVPAAAEKTGGLTDVVANLGDTVVFDGSLSSDVDGTIVEWSWSVCKIDGENCVEETNIGGGVERSFPFVTPGDFMVFLIVKDDDGLWSKAKASVNVHVGYNEWLTMKATWNNGGNVDLHYIRPGGYFNNGSDDCNPNNTSPNWRGFGYGKPEFVRDSRDGISAEEIIHKDPADGSYKLTLYYTKAPEDCGGYDDCRISERDCDNCGCRCWSIFCFWGSLCCNDCNVCTHVPGCFYKPAQVIVRFYLSGSMIPAYTQFFELIPGDSNQHPKIDFIINRAGGRYYFQ